MSKLIVALQILCQLWLKLNFEASLLKNKGMWDKNPK
jgi:hypothetical protein